MHIRYKQYFANLFEIVLIIQEIWQRDLNINKDL